LQLRSSNTPYFPNSWSVFTGGMEESDTSAEYGIRREIGEELHVATRQGEMPYYPEELQLFYTGRYKDQTQDVKQFVFTGKLYTPLDQLIFKEGQVLGLGTRDWINDREIAANYGEIMELYFSNRRIPLFSLT